MDVVIPFLTVIRVGVSVYKPLSNVVSISYPECTDWIEYSRVIQEGYPVINMGNNGLYYSCVTETISGRGSTVYSYQVSPPTSVNESDYPYWENGLLREKAVYDTNGEMLKKIQYIYETDVNYEDKLPQMQPSDFYLDGKSLESFIEIRELRILQEKRFMSIISNHDYLLLILTSSTICNMAGELL